MGADLLIKEDIVLGERIEIIALCSKVEVVQNISTAGSYREIYYLNGKDGAFISGIIFKNFGAEQVDVDVFTDAPVLVEGRVGEYRDTKQIHIESIRPLTEILDKNELLAQMVDTKILDNINDIVWSMNSVYTMEFKHLKAAEGLEEGAAGAFATRMLKFLQMATFHYPEYAQEYIDNISVLSDYYLQTDCSIKHRLLVARVTDSPLVQSLLFGYKDFPEYEEFIKLHHLIMKPRGCELEIMDNAFGHYSSSSRLLQQY